MKRGKLGLNRSALVIPEILGRLVNTLTPDDKNFRRNMQNFQQQVQTPLSQKERTFPGFFVGFLKCKSNSEHFEKKMSILASRFPKLLNPKEEIT